LLWVGEHFYPTIEDFSLEAAKLGISKRISVVPRDFEVGVTWVLLAHPKAIPVMGLVGKDGDGGIFIAQNQWSPGIFKVWRPNKIEKIVQESKRGSEEVAALEKRGITPVFVPDDDPDHATKPTTTQTRATTEKGTSNDERQITTT
jgi:hypothetical protein